MHRHGIINQNRLLILTNDSAWNKGDWPIIDSNVHAGDLHSQLWDHLWLHWGGSGALSTMHQLQETLMDEQQLWKKRIRKTNVAKTAGKSLFLLTFADDAVSLFTLTMKKTIKKTFNFLFLLTNTKK